MPVQQIAQKVMAHADCEGLTIVYRSVNAMSLEPVNDYYNEVQSENGFSSIKQILACVSFLL